MKTEGIEEDEAGNMIPVEDEVANEIDRMESDGTKVGQDIKKPFKRHRASANYTLERWLESKDREGGGPATPNLWEQIKDGFVSPEQAIEYVAEAKLVGIFRAIRVASAEYEAKLTTPEPVLTVSKVVKAKKEKKAK